MCEAAICFHLTRAEISPSILMIWAHKLKVKNYFNHSVNDDDWAEDRAITDSPQFHTHTRAHVCNVHTLNAHMFTVHQILCYSIPPDICKVRQHSCTHTNVFKHTHTITKIKDDFTYVHLWPHPHTHTTVSNALIFNPASYKVYKHIYVLLTCILYVQMHDTHTDGDIWSLLPVLEKNQITYYYHSSVRRLLQFDITGFCTWFHRLLFVRFCINPVEDKSTGLTGEILFTLEWVSYVISVGW